MIHLSRRSQTRAVVSVVVMMALSACAHTEKNYSADEKARIDSIPVMNELSKEKLAEYDYVSMIYCDGKEVFAAPSDDECAEEFRSKAFEAGADLVVKDKQDIRERATQPKKHAKTYRKKVDPTKKYQL